MILLKGSRDLGSSLELTYEDDEVEIAFEKLCDNQLDGWWTKWVYYPGIKCDEYYKFIAAAAEPSK